MPPPTPTNSPSKYHGVLFLQLFGAMKVALLFFFWYGGYQSDVVLHYLQVISEARCICQGTWWMVYAVQPPWLPHSLPQSQPVRFCAAHKQRCPNSVTETSVGLFPYFLVLSLSCGYVGGTMYKPHAEMQAGKCWLIGHSHGADAVVGGSDGLP